MTKLDHTVFPSSLFLCRRVGVRVPETQCVHVGSTQRLSGRHGAIRSRAAGTGIQNVIGVKEALFDLGTLGWDGS